MFTEQNLDAIHFEKSLYLVAEGEKKKVSKNQKSISMSKKSINITKDTCSAKNNRMILIHYILDTYFLTSPKIHILDTNIFSW